MRMFDVVLDRLASFEKDREADREAMLTFMNQNNNQTIDNIPRPSTSSSDNIPRPSTSSSDNINSKSKSAFMELKLRWMPQILYNFEQMNKRFDQMDKRFDQMDNRFNALQNSYGTVKGYMSVAW